MFYRISECHVLTLSAGKVLQQVIPNASEESLFDLKSRKERFFASLRMKICSGDLLPTAVRCR